MPVGLASDSAAPYTRFCYYPNAGGMAPIIMPVDMVMGMGMATGAMGGRGGRGRCAALHPCAGLLCMPCSAAVMCCGLPCIGSHA